MILATVLASLGALAAAPGPPPAPVAVVLGTAQDGGVPQLNCRCERCTAARADPRQRRRVASLALLDPGAADDPGRCYLIDATPDLREQLDSLIDDPLLALPPGRTPLAGILLTHAHVGHYGGLIHFGREVLAASALPLHATPRMLRFLESNAPWSQLVALGQLCPSPLDPGHPLALSPRLRVTPLLVPHRDELSDTVAYLVEGPRRRLLWLPDIDRWERWERDLGELLDAVDYAFLDATFHSADELPGRSLGDIPHPLVPDTAARATGRRARVFLIHLNHSNRLLGPDPGPREELRRQGIEVASEGLRLEL